ncbi:MAG: hypothetical protein ACI83B_000649 [Sediminicola sp.]|jgi:hypothetical protein
MFYNCRIIPSFLVIGGVKCASSSLYRYLIDHPNILPCHKKEPGFFSNRGLFRTLIKLPNYLQNFPKKASEENTKMIWHELNESGLVEQSNFVKERKKNMTYITGEATATYNFAADPGIVRKIFPKMKIIALVRNPTERYISHHKMFSRFQMEGRQGYDVGNLLAFIEKEISDHMLGKKTRILHQGIYYLYLSKWEETFGENQLFIEKSEKLKNEKSANEVLNSLACFLSLPHHNFSNIVSRKFNVAPSKTCHNAEAIALLNEFYRPYNQLLSKHYGIELNE